MSQDSNASDRLRAVLVLVATIGMIAFNWLAAAGYVNNVMPAAIAAKYPTVLAPAGYSFTILSLIYLAHSAFAKEADDAITVGYPLPEGKDSGR